MIFFVGDGKRTLIRRILKWLLHKAGLDIVRHIPPVRFIPLETSKLPLEQSALLTKLHQTFPYSDTDPSIKPFLWSLDGGGKNMIEEKIESENIRCILEIGSFLGGSTEHWLRASPKTFVICVDPWPDGWAGTYAAQNGFPEFENQLNQKDGFFHTFLANLKSYKDRIVPVRDRSPEVLLKFYVMGVRPELIFFDATKISDDIVIAHRLWPEAMLTGDDWNWGGEKEGYPVQKLVKEFAAAEGFEILQKFDTWMLVKKA